MNTRTNNVDSPNSELGFLIEAILNDAYKLEEEMYDLSKARVAAAFASNLSEKERYLRLAVRFAEDGQRLSWRQPLRAHYDLALFLYRKGDKNEAKREFEIVARFIEVRFSKQCLGLIELRALLQSI